MAKAAPATGLLIYTDHPASYVESCEFTSVDATKPAYYTVVKTDGSRLQINPGGLWVVVNYPPLTPQEDIVQTARVNLGQIQELIGKYPQFARPLKQAQSKWENAVAFYQETAKQNRQKISTAPKSPERASDGYSLHIDGMNFENVILTSIDGDNIGIEHEAGIAKLPLSKLTKDQIVALNNTSMSVHIDPDWANNKAAQEKDKSGEMAATNAHANSEASRSELQGTPGSDNASANNADDVGILGDAKKQFLKNFDSSRNRFKDWEQAIGTTALPDGFEFETQLQEFYKTVPLYQSLLEETSFTIVQKLTDHTYEAIANTHYGRSRIVVKTTRTVFDSKGIASLPLLLSGTSIVKKRDGFDTDVEVWQEVAQENCEEVYDNCNRMVQLLSVAIRKGLVPRSQLESILEKIDSTVKQSRKEDLMSDRRLLGCFNNFAGTVAYDNLRYVILSEAYPDLKITIKPLGEILFGKWKGVYSSITEIEFKKDGTFSMTTNQDGGIPGLQSPSKKQSVTTGGSWRAITKSTFVVVVDGQQSNGSLEPNEHTLMIELPKGDQSRFDKSR